MNTWLCKRCFELEDDALELHIQAHARTSVWSYDEVKQAIHALRESARHCAECEARVTKDVVERDLVVFDETTTFREGQLEAVRATRVPIVPFHRVTLDLPRRQGRTAMAEQFEQLNVAWKTLIEDLTKAFEPFARHVLPKPPSDDPKTRALEARRNRNTGPARPSGPTAKRPRRHK